MSCMGLGRIAMVLPLLSIVARWARVSHPLASPLTTAKPSSTSLFTITVSLAYVVSLGFWCPITATLLFRFDSRSISP